MTWRTPFCYRLLAVTPHIVCFLWSDDDLHSNTESHFFSISCMFAHLWYSSNRESDGYSGEGVGFLCCLLIELELLCLSLGSL